MRVLGRGGVRQKTAGGGQTASCRSQGAHAMATLWLFRDNRECWGAPPWHHARLTSLLLPPTASSPPTRPHLWVQAARRGIGGGRQCVPVRAAGCPRIPPLSACLPYLQVTERLPLMQHQLARPAPAPAPAHTAPGLCRTWVRSASASPALPTALPRQQPRLFAGTLRTRAQWTLMRWQTAQNALL